MRHVDSDQVPLEELPRIRPPRNVRRLMETMFVICSLFLGGVGTGFVYASRTTDNEFTRMREDHLQEIERLQSAHQYSIAALTRSTVKAADAAAVASDQATAAAEAVGDVAKKIERNAAPKKAP